MGQFIIPCADCDRSKERLEEDGFEVHGCAPHSSSGAGMCLIRFSPKVSTGAAAAPALIAPHPAANLATAANDVLGGAMAATLPTAPASTSNALPTLTPTQVRTAQAIVNLFETSQVLGNYGQVTLLEGDPGRLTYGRSQTTLGSGLLLQLLQQYCDNAGARLGPRLKPWLPTVAEAGPEVDTNGQLHNLLRACADDPVMRETQDQFFDTHFWRPALRAAAREGLRQALSVAVVYDSLVHGSWVRLRDRTTAVVGSSTAVGERRWVTAYVQQRRAWLANHSLAVLRPTVYRMDAFLRLIDLGAWGLPLPLVVRDAEISMFTLNGVPPGCYDGPTPGSRALMLAQPLQRGLDARLVQLALSDAGAQIKADGVFGRASAERIREWQALQGLPATGVADAAAIARLLG